MGDPGRGGAVGTSPGSLSTTPARWVLQDQWGGFVPCPGPLELSSDSLAPGL